MKRTKPVLDGVDASRADAFARWRILSLRAAARRRDFRPRLSLVPNAEINAAEHLPDDLASWQAAAHDRPVVDPGLAVEVTGRLLQQTGGVGVTAVWTRDGPNEPADSDAGWWAALRQGAAIAGVPAPSLLVVTRWGWRCLPSGCSRTWQRLRHGE